MKPGDGTSHDPEHSTADLGGNKRENDKRFPGTGVSGRHGLAGEDRYSQGGEGPSTNDATRHALQAEHCGHELECR